MPIGTDPATVGRVLRNWLVMQLVAIIIAAAMIFATSEEWIDDRFFFVALGVAALPMCYLLYAGLRMRRTE